MIDRGELALIVAGAVSEAVAAVHSVRGSVLSRDEAARIGEVIAAALRLVAERSAAAARPQPPPPPAPDSGRRRLHARFFDPLRTTEFRAPTAEELDAAAAKLPRGAK